MKAQNNFIFDFTYIDLLEYAQSLANKLGVAFENNEIKYPSHIADGYCKFFKINEFMSFQVVHYTAKQKMVFNRYPSQSNHISITFQDFTFAKCDKHDYDCNEIILNNESLGSIQCKSTRLNEIIVIEPGLEVKVVLVLMKENWVDNVLHDSVSKEKFIRYLVNQHANLRKEFLSIEQSKFFNEIFISKKFTLLENLYYEGRIFNLLESFLNDVLTKEETEGNLLFDTPEDIRMLQQAEKFINDSLMEPFAGVEHLSRICCMSRTKFINLFQKVYGVSSFDYYQKKRLNIAYECMKSGKHTVSGAAQIIGYTGINNFAIAFKKEFGLLPSELLDKVKYN
jgi:AraC-like DNA-binding protein